MAPADAIAQVTPLEPPRTLGRVSPASSRASPVPTLEDFAVLCEVGRGAFGRVVLARCKATGDLRALKAVPKVRLVTAGSDAIRHMHDEAAIQRSIDHPFALALRGAFQDDTTVYLVTDHCPGGTLHAVLGRFGRLDGDLATFYAAQLVDVLAHLHAQDVAFRDVKPENALLDERGYLRLADFGLARRVDGDDGRCRTRCGTPLYAAPEVISGRSHGRPVDAWALGCVIVEMRTGRPPFVGSTVSQVEALVLEADLGWLGQLDDPVKGLCRLLLAKKPANRARCAAAKLHAAFSTIDFAQLREKQTVAPYLPDTARDVLGAGTPTPKGSGDSFSSFASFSTLNDEGSSKKAHPAEPVRGELGRPRGVNAVAAKQGLAGLDGRLAGLAGLDELAAPREPHADDDRRGPETTLQAAAAVGAARTQFAETEQVHVFVRAVGAGGDDRLPAGRAPVAAKAQSCLGSIRGDRR